MALTKEEQKRRAELLAKGLKVCYKCGRELPVEQFSKCKSNKDGLNNKCKECDNKHVNQYNQQHKEEKQQYQRQYDKKVYEAIKNGTHIVKPAKTNEQFLQELYEVNPDIEVLEDYQGAKIKIKFKCKLDGCIWEATPNNLLNGQGCPKCNTTKGEKRVANYLDTLGIDYIYNIGYFNDLVGIGDGLLRPDFIIPSLKIWIEYDGIQHFEPTDFTSKMSDKEVQEQFKIRQQNDKIKNQYAKDNNWTLIRIPYWEIDNIEQILDSYLK